MTPIFPKKDNEKSFQKVKLEIRLIIKKCEKYREKFEKEITQFKRMFMKFYKAGEIESARKIVQRILIQNRRIEKITEMINELYINLESIDTELVKAETTSYAALRTRTSKYFKKSKESRKTLEQEYYYDRSYPDLISGELELDIPTEGEEAEEIDKLWNDLVIETMVEEESTGVESPFFDDFCGSGSAAPSPQPSLPSVPPSGGAPPSEPIPRREFKRYLERELEYMRKEAKGNGEDVPLSEEKQKRRSSAAKELPKSIQRYADIISDKEMEFDKETKITVQVKKESTSIMGVKVTFMVELPKKGLPELEILVLAPGFDVPKPRKKLVIPLDRDSDRLEFALIPKEIGKRYIFVEFYQEGKMIGRAILDVQIKHKALIEAEKIKKGFALEMVKNVEIDVTLRINRHLNEFIFNLFTKHIGTILDPNATFGSKTIEKEYVENLNHHIRNVAFDFENPDKSLKAIVQLGQLVYKLIPEPMRAAIKKINPKYLIIETGDLFVPWELAHDGEDFLCLKYCIGKRILDETKDFHSPPMCFGDPEFDFILIESNPKNDLDLKERYLIKQIIKDYEINFTTFRKKNANKKLFKEMLSQPLEIIHFAGHGKFDPKNPDKSGILLEDGLLTSKEIKKLKINGFPLIFANACESGTITKVNKMEGVGGLARSFLGSGAIGFVGPLWEITDNLAAEFAAEFYKKILTQQISVGEAIREVKSELKSKYSHILWATFNYFGDPTLKICPKVII